MSRSWSDYEKEIDRGPAPTWRVAFFAAVAIFGLMMAVGGVAYVAGWFTEAAQVAQEEFGARAMLQKYEWFKSAAAQADANRASIQVYEARFAQLKAAYGGAPRSAWSRDDREQANLWQQEVAGTIASYNNLAADYNAQMAKFNYRFANVGDLPAGATVPLPREFKPYMTGVE